MSNNIRTSFMLPHTLYKALLAESKRTGAPIAELIRRALAAYLEGRQ